MSELTLTVVRLGLLVLLWLFVFSIVGVLRGDLYGTRIVHRSGGGDGRSRIRPVSNAAPIHRPPRPRRGPTALTVVEGALRGTTIPLKPAGVLLGRNPECTLVLDDEYASGRHARIFQDDGSWFVEDLGSTNGTYVAGERLTGARQVDEGAQLRIGTTVLELRR